MGISHRNAAARATIDSRKVRCQLFQRKGPTRMGLRSYCRWMKWSARKPPITPPENPPMALKTAAAAMYLLRPRPSEKPSRTLNCPNWTPAHMAPPNRQEAAPMA